MEKNGSKGRRDGRLKGRNRTEEGDRKKGGRTRGNKGELRRGEVI